MDLTRVASEEAPIVVRRGEAPGAPDPDDIAEVCIGQGRLREAVARLSQSRQRCEEAADDAGAGRAARALGRVRWLQGRWDEAESSYRDSIVSFQRAGARPALAAALHDLGFVALARGRLDDAADCLERGVPLVLEPGDVLMQGRSLALLGLTHLLAGRRDDAYGRWHDAQRVLADASSPGAQEVRDWVAQWTASAQPPPVSAPPSPPRAASSSEIAAGWVRAT